MKMKENIKQIVIKVITIYTVAKYFTETTQLGNSYFLLISAFTQNTILIMPDTIKNKLDRVVNLENALSSKMPVCPVTQL